MVIRKTKTKRNKKVGGGQLTKAKKRIKLNWKRNFGTLLNSPAYSQEKGSPARSFQAWPREPVGNNSEKPNGNASFQRAITCKSGSCRPALA